MVLEDLPKAPPPEKKATPSYLTITSQIQFKRSALFTSSSFPSDSCSHFLNHASLLLSLDMSTLNVIRNKDLTTPLLHPSLQLSQLWFNVLISPCISRTIYTYSFFTHQSSTIIFPDQKASVFLSKS